MLSRGAAGPGRWCSSRSSWDGRHFTLATVAHSASTGNELWRDGSAGSYCSTFSTIPVKKFSELKPQTTFFQKKQTRPQTTRSWPKTSVSKITPTVETFDENHILFGKNVVFTGELQSIEREVAMQQVVNLGGLVKSGVSGKTDYLVVGVQDQSIVGENGISTKEKKAYELIEKGKELKIIKEAEFMMLLNNSFVS